MQLQSISYSEYANSDGFWQLNEICLEDLNLFVGKNATGKSRTLALIQNAAALVTGKQEQLFDSCQYEMTLGAGDQTLKYIFAMKDRKVLNETVILNGQTMLNRSEDGSGTLVYAAEDGKALKFDLEPTRLAVTQKQDRLQHPYLVELVSWARSVHFYAFSTDFGRKNMLTLEQAQGISESLSKGLPLQPFWGEENVLATYILGCHYYKEEFDRAIIRDMAAMGYEITEVGCEAISIGLNTPIVSLFVQEKGVNCKIHQLRISQGMFRALALTICMNKCQMDGGKQLVIVDDIGEGLDYRRSSAAIEFLLQKAKESQCQLIMSTNDEFTMNHVPLEYWSLLQRDKNIVSARTWKNSSDEFNKFKFMGLNNFDFFTSHSHE